MGFDLLPGIVLLLTLAVGIAAVFHLFHAPSTIGFLVAGVLLSPSLFSFVSEDQALLLVDIGLVPLLFIVGLELAPRPLHLIGRNLYLAASVQLLATAGIITTALVWAGGLEMPPAFLLGVAVALSSTAITFTQLSEARESRSAVGLITATLLLLQDAFIILLMFLLPIINYATTGTWTEGLRDTLLGMAAITAFVVLLRLTLPRIMCWAVRPGGREFLLLFTVFFVCAAAWFFGWHGWPRALGACVAGMLLSSTPLRPQLMTDLSPFRDLTNALFFISLGMLVDLRDIQPYLPAISLAILGTLALKISIATLATRLGGWPLRPALFVSIGLCTVSEFGYLLVREAYNLEMITRLQLQIFIAYAVGMMLAGSTLFLKRDWITGTLLAIAGGGREPQPGLQQWNMPEEPFEGHLIIVGFGTNGVNLTQTLKAVRVRHCLIEMNPELVRAARTAEVPVIVGDASREAVLRAAGIDHARGLVVAINDATATECITRSARSLRNDLYILVRIQSLSEIDTFYAAGASEVIPEDFESSIEMVVQALKRFGIADNLLEAQVTGLRTERYRGVRVHPDSRMPERDLLQAIGLTTTTTIYLTNEYHATGKTLLQTNLRARSGATVIAVVRRGKPTPNPPPDCLLQPGDILVLMGNGKQLHRAWNVITGIAPDLHHLPPEETSH